MKDSELLIQLMQRETGKMLKRFGLAAAFATVDPAYTTGRPKVTFDGEGALSVKQFPYLSTFTPVASDRVLMLKVGATWLVLGKVI